MDHTRRALQITSGLLQAVTKQAESFGEMDRWTIRRNGEVIAECTIAEALDLANEALEPEALTTPLTAHDREERRGM